MSAQFEQYRFDEDALREMNNFKKDFMSNRYKKDTSENKGPNYKKQSYWMIKRRLKNIWMMLIHKTF